MALDLPRHPDAESLAEYADGVLEAEARAGIERHLAECDDCRAVVLETMLFLEANPATVASASAPRVVPFRGRRWVTGVAAGLAVAAALVLAIRIAQPTWMDRLFGSRGDRPELQELIAAVANEPTRPVEGRLSGGFKYGPPPSPTRGAGDREPSPDVRIAAANVETQANGRQTPNALAEIGVARLMEGQAGAAVISLRASAAKNPGMAAFQNDLAVAYLARASRAVSTVDLENALAAADRAIALDGVAVEPHFNRALALERLRRDEDARSAWRAYLALDPQSPWAAEARQHLDVLAGAPRH